jgi:hypothetical protein
MPERPRARLVTTAWGETYIAKLLDLTIPALLAPGNLPAMARDFDLEFAIAAESHVFERLLASDAIRRLAAFAKPILRPIDDLVDHPAGYGQALTRALHRGFDDLGEKMVGAHLMFLNADFVVADGGYANLAKRILAGESLIFAPSYCAVLEAVDPILRAARDPKTGILRMSPRAMARAILDFRHMTVLAKTVNRRFMHMHVTDQFYWEVDRDTLLGRQLPISLVYMRPQRAYLEPICFWDYAVISSTCPTAPRSVMGDSDEFLMLELRKEKTFEELMRLGRLSAGEIAKGLAYMTPDQLEMGRYDLTLRANELPEGIDKARASLGEFVDSVYARLEPPASATNHKYWVDQIDTARAAKGVQVRARDDRAYRVELIEAAQTGDWPDSRAAETAEEGPRAPGGQDAKRGIAARAFGATFGFVPRVTRLHPDWAELRHPVEAFDEALARFPSPDILFVRNPGPSVRLAALVRGAPGTFAAARALPLLRHGLPLAAGDFDVAVIEANWMELNELPRMVEKLRRRLRKGARLIAHHAFEEPLRNPVPISIAPFVPRGYDVDIRFSGSQENFDLRRRLHAAHVRNAGAADGALRNLATLAAAAPRAWFANAAQAARPSWRPGDFCLSITVIVDFPTE